MEKILVFGHKNPDTDAICSSLVMADLQTKIRGEEVISCRLGNLNEETKYALNYFKVEEPKLIEKVDEGQRVILVDHNEFTQSVEGIEKAKIEAVVDHHRINNFKTSEPLFYYAQPVGCTSTVLFELYNTNNIKIEQQIAGLMLSAIISDTLLLKSPTTTDKDKKAVVVGRSLVVGKPAAMMLLKKNATVTICHTRTKDMPSVVKEADIVIVAAGRAGVVDDTYLRAGQTVIDVGINVNEEGKLCGDVAYAKAEPIVEAITPVPGGVGSVTTSVLVGHVVEAAMRKNS